MANIDEALTNGQIGRQSRSVPFWNTACPDSFVDARKGPFDSPDGSLKVSQARGSATHRVQSRGFGDRRRSRFFYIPHPTPPFPLPIGVYSDISLAPAMSSSNDSSESASQENERRRAERKPAVRWRSRIGVATALFLVGGAINFASAVSTPILLHFLGPDASGGLVLSNDADAAFLGRSLTAVNAADPAMGAYLVIFMYTMCAFMMAFAILQLGVAWFAVRRAQAWGVWAGLLANEAVVPYYLAVSASFAQRGAPILGGLEFILVITAVTVPATVLGLSGVRGTRRPSSLVS